MAKKMQRPIDVQDAPWSHIGKDALDAAAERVWNTLRADAAIVGADAEPYHLLWSDTKTTVQHAVLDVLGLAVPALLRERAKDMKRSGAHRDEYEALTELADELEAEHGGER